MKPIIHPRRALYAYAVFIFGLCLGRTHVPFVVGLFGALVSPILLLTIDRVLFWLRRSKQPRPTGVETYRGKR